MQLKKILMMVAVAALACSVMAQGGGGQGRRGGRGFGTGPSSLVNRADVQADIALTDDEKSKITELGSSAREQMQQIRTDANGDREAMQKAMQAFQVKQDAAVMAILTPDQQKRINEIRIQIEGNTAAARADIQEALGLTDDQKTKIKDLQKTAQDANASVFQKVQSGELTREEVGPTMTKNQQALKDEIGKVLTDDQKAKLKTMGGTKVFVQTPTTGGGGLF